MSRLVVYDSLNNTELVYTFTSKAGKAAWGQFQEFKEAMDAHMDTWGGHVESCIQGWVHKVQRKFDLDLTVFNACPPADGAPILCGELTRDPDDGTVQIPFSTDNGSIYFIDFATAEQAMSWCHDFIVAKASHISAVAEMNSTGNYGTLSDAGDWMTSTRALKTKWGDGRVPLYLRSELQGAEREFGLTVTEFADIPPTHWIRQVGTAEWITQRLIESIDASVGGHLDLDVVVQVGVDESLGQGVSADETGQGSGEESKDNKGDGDVLGERDENRDHSGSDS